MKHLTLLLTALLLLASCSANKTAETDLSYSIPLAKRLTNPLFAEDYSKLLVGNLTELEITKDPILSDPETRKYVEEEKARWMLSGRNARKLQSMGISGEFVGEKEHARGEALFLNNILFLGTGFETDPGPSLHVYLTEKADPRDTDFPDESSIDLGLLESHFGAQSYKVPFSENSNLLRTAVLYDAKLKRIFGFAQLYD